MHSTQTPELESLRTRILPRVQAPGPGSYMDLVAGQLSVGLVLEGPDGTRPVGDLDLQNWRTSTEALVPTAIQNLRERSSVDSWYSLRAVPGMLVYQSGDGHAAARLLLIKELVKPWPLGGVLISVPTPDQLLCVPLENLDNLATVQVLVQSSHLAHQLGTRPVTDQVFWYDGENWAHLVVRHKDDSVEVLPPPGFLKMVEKLAALRLTNLPGEA